MPRDLSVHQRKIVNRYYDHRETIALTKLSEIVSDLYLADTASKQKTLWTRAHKALTNLAKERVVDQAKADAIVERRDIEALAEIANKSA